MNFLCFFGFLELNFFLNFHLKIEFALLFVWKFQTLASINSWLMLWRTETFSITKQWHGLIWGCLQHTKHDGAEPAQFILCICHIIPKSPSWQVTSIEGVTPTHLPFLQHYSMYDHNLLKPWFLIRSDMNWSQNIINLQTLLLWQPQFFTLRFMARIFLLSTV